MSGGPSSLRWNFPDIDLGGGNSPARLVLMPTVMCNQEKRTLDTSEGALVVDDLRESATPPILSEGFCREASASLCFLSIDLSPMMIDSEWCRWAQNVYEPLQISNACCNLGSPSLRINIPINLSVDREYPGEKVLGVQTNLDRPG